MGKIMFLKIHQIAVIRMQIAVMGHQIAVMGHKFDMF